MLRAERYYRSAYLEEHCGHPDVASASGERKMRALCPWDRGQWALGISSGPIKKFFTFKVKGFLVCIVSQ